jgi:2-dehydropantoate 2-reductase
MISSGKDILVAGCGAVGSVFGCLLRKAGHKVSLLGRPWHLDAIRAGGLRMDGIWGSHTAAGFTVFNHPNELAGFSYDLILITVKSYDTRSMVDAVSPLLREDGLALSLQNGLGNIETLAESFGSSRSLGASVLVGAKNAAPGAVTVTVQAAPVVVGPIDSAAAISMERTRGWMNIFTEAGIPCEATEQILSHIWAKVFYNASLNPLGALLRVHYGALAETGELRNIMDQIIEEAFQVAQRKNVELLWERAGQYRKLFYEKLVPKTCDHQSSMLQDLERGKRTEIDALNGKIWSYARQLGLATPFNETLTRLIQAKERRVPSATVS